MPLAALFLGSIGQILYRFIVYLVGAQHAARVAAVLALASIYIACVSYFSSMIVPWLQGIFSSAYGSLLGLLFPPVSGTVLASLSAYWVCVYGVHYVSSLTKAAMGK
ncbi:hypothetical protein [Comamonas aquatica]|uniref:hypothetical protein n=1 Tax=Comamonas aquatica TaxID=225991 RepID=UPI003D032DF7